LNWLTLPLKREYFEQIRDGQKLREYRLVTPYWRRRLDGRSFDGITLTMGYPSINDGTRRLYRAWRGFSIERIQHPHFGPEEVEVYAIDVSTPI